MPSGGEASGSVLLISTSLLPSNCRYLMTMSTSRVVEYRGCGGQKLYIPFSSWMPSHRDSLNVYMGHGDSWPDCVDWAILHPFLKQACQELKEGLDRAWNRINFSLRTPAIQSLPCTLVCGICPFAPSSCQELCEVSPEIPAVCCLCLITSRRLVVYHKRMRVAERVGE